MSQGEALDRLLDEATRLRGLEFGWDGAIAPPPSDEAWSALVELLGVLHMREVGVALARVRPDVEGGMGLALGNLQVSCPNDGGWVGTWCEGPGEPSIVCLCEDELGLEGFVDWIEALP